MALFRVVESPGSFVRSSRDQETPRPKSAVSALGRGVLHLLHQCRVEPRGSGSYDNVLQVVRMRTAGPAAWRRCAGGAEASRASRWRAQWRRRSPWWRASPEVQLEVLLHDGDHESHGRKISSRSLRMANRRTIVVQGKLRLMVRKESAPSFIQGSRSRMTSMAVWTSWPYETDKRFPIRAVSVWFLSLIAAGHSVSDSPRS